MEMIITAVSVLIMIGAMIRGCHRGLSEQLRSTLCILEALVALGALFYTYISYKSGNKIGCVFGMILLTLLFLVYRVLDYIVSAIRFIFSLPVIQYLDHFAGIAAGAVEGYALLLIMVKLCRTFLPPDLTLQFEAAISGSEVLSFAFGEDLPLLLAVGAVEGFTALVGMIKKG